MSLSLHQPSKDCWAGQTPAPGQAHTCPRATSRWAARVWLLFLCFCSSFTDAVSLCAADGADWFRCVFSWRRRRSCDGSGVWEQTQVKVGEQALLGPSGLIPGSSVFVWDVYCVRYSCNTIMIYTHAWQNMQYTAEHTVQNIPQCNSLDLSFLVWPGRRFNIFFDCQKFRCLCQKWENKCKISVFRNPLSE